MGSLSGINLALCAVNLGESAGDSVAPDALAEIYATAALTVRMNLPAFVAVSNLPSLDKTDIEPVMCNTNLVIQGPLSSQTFAIYVFKMKVQGTTSRTLYRIMIYRCIDTLAIRYISYLSF